MGWALLKPSSRWILRGGSDVGDEMCCMERCAAGCSTDGDGDDDNGSTRLAGTKASLLGLSVGFRIDFVINGALALRVAVVDMTGIRMAGLSRPGWWEKRQGFLVHVDFSGHGILSNNPRRREENMRITLQGRSIAPLQMGDLRDV